jgi:hypothetical protein
LQVLRQIEIQHVMGSVLADYQAGGPVNMTSKLQEMGIDNLVRMIFAKPHLGATECLTRDEMVTLKGLVKEAVNLAGVIYAGDFIPLLDIYDFTVSFIQSPLMDRSAVKVDFILFSFTMNHLMDRCTLKVGLKLFS